MRLKEFGGEKRIRGVYMGLWRGTSIPHITIILVSYQSVELIPMIYTINDDQICWHIRVPPFNVRQESLSV